MFRLPGIFRTVALHSKPKVHIKDLQVFPDLDKAYNDGTITVNASILNLSKKDIKDYKLVYSLYENKLYSDDNTNTGVVGSVTIAKINKLANTQPEKAILKINSPKKWSAERPNRYTLVAELKDAKNKTIENFMGNLWRQLY